MTIAVQSGSGRDGKNLPEDLSLYIGKKSLVKLILEAIEELSAETADGGDVQSGNTDFQPAMMLTLLAYCYATGVYGSEEIRLATHDDQMIRYLCARDYPDLCQIRSFRRYNRDRIAHCLAGVFRRVWEVRFCGEDAVPLASGSCPGAYLGRWVGATGTPDFRREAERRIMRAVRADSMATDD